MGAGGRASGQAKMREAPPTRSGRSGGAAGAASRRQPCACSLADRVDSFARAASRAPSTPPLVWSNRLIDNRAMDSGQAACRRRPRELLVKVVGSSSPPLSLW